MALDPVNRLNQMMDILRREMAESSRRADIGRAPTDKLAQQAQVAGRPGLQELRSKIHERLRTLDQTDPRRPQKAKRLFLESVLTWEFGNELLLDRRFEDMLEGIQETISADPELDARFGELLNDIGGAT